MLKKIEMQMASEKLINELDNIYKSTYDYRSKEGIEIAILGNLEIQSIKIPKEIKNLENENELLLAALNDVIHSVKEAVEREFQQLIMKEGGLL